VFEFSACDFSRSFGYSRWMALSLIAQIHRRRPDEPPMVTTNTLLQMFVSDELRGRVMSIYTLSFIGTARSAASLSALSASIFNPRFAVYFCAIFLARLRILLLTKLKLIASAQEETEAAGA